MSEKLRVADEMEPERYELREAPAQLFEATRRDFFRFLGAGIFVVCAAKAAPGMQESGGGRKNREDTLPQEIEAWLHIGEKGDVTAFTGKVEVGQNIRTSLTQFIAEELRVPMEQVKLVMGDTQLVPFDMGTFGSRTTPYMSPQLRRAAACARNSLLAVAAKQWNTDAAKLLAADGKIRELGGKRLATYGELAKGLQLTQVIPADEATTPPNEWKVAGQPAKKVNGRDFVTGKHRYAWDMTRPGMLYGKVLRAPAYGATLITADTSAAAQMPGVTVVQDGGFVAVAAPSSALAAKAAAAIRAEWKTTPQPSSGEIFEYLKKNSTPPEEGDNGATFESGDAAKAIAAAAHRVSGAYNVQYIAHAPLEPRAAVAEWDGDEVTVWTGTQRPFGVRSELATAFHMPEQKVRVIMPDTGSGYGGKHTADAALEAARLARAAKKPVKVAWTRQEEFDWAYFRPAGVIEITSGTDADGKILGWEFRNYNSGTAAFRTYYDIPNQRIAFHAAKSPLRQGSYRGLAATANHFAREVHMDEIAATLKMDPVEFRLKNLKDERLRAVFEQGAKQFGWGKKLPAHHAAGVGGGFEKLGYVGTFVEIAVNPANGEIRLQRVLTSFDCGAVVNPDGLKNQLIGANIMGLGGALFEKIDFENGKVSNNQFSKYRVPRFRDVPPMEVLLINRPELPPVGAGEAPIVGLAPAISNAVFAATGIRLRSLPMGPELTSQGYQFV